MTRPRSSPGIGVALSPGGDFLGPRPPGPPARAVLSFPPGGSQASLSSSEVGDGLASLGAKICAPPGPQVSPGLLGLLEGGPGLSQPGGEVESLRVRGGGPGPGQGKGDDPGVVRVGQRYNSLPDGRGR
jgi:hypothetical protein